MDSRVKSKETVGNSWTVFKSYFGSQISSQSLNDYSQNPQQKVSFFHIFLSLIVLSRCHGLQMANEANEVLLGKQPR